MATHDDIGLSQPAASTITKKLDAISLDANSTTVLREVMVLGSPETTNALAQVMAGAPASTDWGLVTRVVGYSTVVSVAAVPANSSQVEVRAITGPVSTAAPASGDTGVIVRQVGYSTVVSIAAITGPVSTAAPATSDTGVIVRQVGYSTVVTVAAVPANSSLVSVTQIAAGLLSSAAAAGNSSALLVRVVGGASSAADFVSNVSSVAGVVSVAPNSTGWVKNAGLSVDSSNYLNVNASFTGSTTVSVAALPLLSSAAPAGNSSALLVRIAGGPSSAADVAITIHGNQSSNSSVYLPVRITNGTAFAALGQDYLHESTLTASSVAGPMTMLRASSTTPPAVSTSDMFVAPWGTLHGAQMMSIVTSSGASAMDSTTPALKVNVVAGATAGPTSTAAPAASDTGLVVRQVGYSTVVSVAAMPANSSLVQVNAFASGYVSSAAPAAGSSGLVVWPVGYSTIVTVAALPANSSQVEVRAMPANSSLVSITAFPSAMVSSLAAAPGSSALLVRQVASSMNSTSVVVTSSNSTVLLTVLSSQAAAQRVHAFFVGVSTATAMSTIIFMSGSTNHVWGVNASSLVWGANLAVNPPAELFRAAAGEPLNVVIQNASTAVTARISVSWRQDA